MLAKHGTLAPDVGENCPRSRGCLKTVTMWRLDVSESNESEQMEHEKWRNARPMWYTVMNHVPYVDFAYFKYFEKNAATSGWRYNDVKKVGKKLWDKDLQRRALWTLFALILRTCSWCLSLRERNKLMHIIFGNTVRLELDVLVPNTSGL